MSETIKSSELKKHVSEDDIQASFFAWLDTYSNRFPILGLFFAIPNGSNKSRMERWKFQRTGLKSGVLDTFLPVARQNKIGLWIEFKSATGTLFANQKRWISDLKAQGYRVEVCRDWKDAANITIDYLSLDIKEVK